MKALRFAAMIGIGFSLIAGLYIWAFLYSWTQPLWPHDWLRNVYLIKEELASNSPSPRWFLVGGSSVLFGFQSSIIEQAAGSAVVNLGCHAELPLKFQLWQVERHAQPGDTVVLAEELCNFWQAPHYTTYAAAQIGLSAPDYFWKTSLLEKAQLIKAIPPVRVLGGVIARLRSASPSYVENLKPATAKELMSNLRAHWRGTFDGVVPKYYNYLELDPHGDMARPRQSAIHSDPDYGFSANHAIQEEVWSELSNFARRMKAAHVRCLFTWQPLERHKKINYNSSVVRSNFAEVRDLLTAAGWTEVGLPEDSILDPKYFYDTPYHLTLDGARLRTERFVDRLISGKMLRSPAAPSYR